MHGFSKIIHITKPTTKQRNMLSSEHGGSRIAPGVWFLGDRGDAIGIAKRLLAAGHDGQTVQVFEVLATDRHGAIAHR
jgi:hypothetical protein